MCENYPIRLHRYITHNLAESFIESERVLSDREEGILRKKERTLCIFGLIILTMNTLSEQFPTVFSICQNQECNVAGAASCNFALPFRRTLHGDLLLQLNTILVRMKTITLSNNPDGISRCLNNNGLFSTRSMYRLLANDIA